MELYIENVRINHPQFIEEIIHITVIRRSRGLMWSFLDVDVCLGKMNSLIFTNYFLVEIKERKKNLNDY